MARESSTRPRRTLRRRLAWGLVALLALRAVLPFALERIAEAAGSDRIGRRVEIADVDLVLLAGGLIVEDVRVGPLGRRGEPLPEIVDGEEHFTLERLAVDLGWLRLLGGTVHVEDVKLVAPAWLLLRDASGELVPVLLPREEVAAEETPEARSGPGLPVRLDRLGLERLDVRFLDLARPDDLPLRFQLAELRVEGLERRGEELALQGVGLRAPRLRVLRDIDLSFLAAEQEVAAQDGELAAVAQEDTEVAAEDAEVAAEDAEVAAEDAVPAAATPEPEGAEGVAETRPPRLRLGRVDIETAGLLLVTQDGEVATSLAFHAEGVTLERGVTFPIRAELGIEPGEVVLEGEAGAFPPVFAGTLRWRDLPLATLGNAAGALSPLLVDAGQSSGELRIDAQMGGAPSARVGASGTVGVEGLAARDRDGALAVGWSQLEIGLEELDLDPGGERPARVTLSKLALAEPRLRVVRASAPEPPPSDAESPPPDAEPSPSGAKPPPGDAAGPPVELTLARLELSGGELEFVDETLAPVHRSRIVELAVQGERLRWPERQAERLAVSFQGPDAARFTLDAAVAEQATRAHLELRELGLPAFSAYAAEAVGYWFEEGQLSLEADVAVDGGQTTLDSHLDFVRLDLAEVEPGSFERQFGVPVGLGLALLRDPSGRIDLPIRATLAEDGSRVNVTAILLAALRQAILGALTAPLKTAGLLLGGEEGAGGMRLEPIAMAPGSAAASDQDLASLEAMAGVLEARPGLALELHGALSPEDDRALAEAILEEQVVADAKLPPVEAGFLQRRRLRGALRDRAEGGKGELDAEDRQALERWIAAMEVPEERRAALARERVESVREALVRRHGVDASRVQLGDAMEGAPGVLVGLAPLAQ